MIGTFNTRTLNTKIPHVCERLDGILLLLPIINRPHRTSLPLRRLLFHFLMNYLSSCAFQFALYKRSARVGPGLVCGTWMQINDALCSWSKSLWSKFRVTADYYEARLMKHLLSMSPAMSRCTNSCGCACKMIQPPLIIEHSFHFNGMMTEQIKVMIINAKLIRFSSGFANCSWSLNIFDLFICRLFDDLIRMTGITFTCFLSANENDYDLKS